ncbi:transcription-repair coupling factor [Lachnospira hominis (ex Liu et al. 2021)]|uniref:Transcription-repair-coupling factor n=1 Tax=Lachnospira hominis (ex Liu et al. 2021) TaxID=2763051 RepID=A0ABR7FX84_9FIRM|nr:transcription-repair coupling factor [Lachnospira hominis]MBC5679799.1 transcription-repair coupling factor [Lachnospira hominis]
MKTFYAPLSELAGIEQLKKDFEVTGQPVMISGCIDTQKIHLVHAAVNDYRFRLIITGDEAKAREMQEDSRFFDKSSIYYPAKDFIFYSADVHGNQLAGERLRCIQKIIAAQDNRTNITVITTIDGCVDMLMPLQRYRDNIIHFKNSDIIDTEKLISKLVGIGYTRVPMIDGQGQFAVRGGIIDIFSYTDETPVRIELWDDEIDSIRFFDVESQRSVEKIQTYDVFPATEWILSEDEIDAGFEKVKDEVEKQLVTLGNDKKKKTQQEMDACNRLRHAYADFERTRDYSKFILSFTDEIEGFTDYFPKDETVFVLDEPDRIMERMELISYEYEESMKNRLEGGYVVASQTKLMRPIAEVYKNMQSSRLMLLSSLDYKPKMLKPADYLRIDARSISSYNNSFEYLADDINKYKRTGYRVVLVCNSRTRAARIVADLEELGTQSYFSEDYDKEIMPGTVMVTYGNIHRGFEYPLIGFVIITENDIFTSRTRKKQKKKYEGRSIAGFNELNVGDYVVHEMHGLGVYKGIEKITVEGVEKDYIKIEYAGNSNLYVLATQLDRLQKYAASDTEKKPKLNKLGSVEWNKTKAKVHGAVEEIAKDLVELYSIRQNQKGYAFGPDTVWQKEFEEMFPYEETDDQLNAIADTKADMESTRIMDRLICGDVGYGKTEVAIRAAFKAVQEGKQVAYLVPTTILAQQHFNTFEQRMKNFPLKVAQLSSFRTNKEIKETLADLKKGFVDVVIGTHRLLSKDVEFKDLGLLIIDEEQRFGVAHKEKIKKLKNNIDVLTLSATPIPRTLHMSLVGIRDMSVLEEPPVDRVPIQTFVTEHNDEMIREAINRELARGGQVYYVYNRVRSIDEAAAHIQELVPQANVAFAHGQMEKRELEKIMVDFINGDIDVLISTTIIETGMDISNVNTMIIEDADKFGLSQLYQLRGRVGRSNRTAYAFLLYRRDRMLTEVAEKRLSAIREFSDFGSGFKIAMKDLEIRGAGNVLGKSQHGHMAAVGYDLYCKMLNEAVNDLKGIKNEYSFETNVDLSVDAYIPSTYIKSEYQKLDIYKRIAAIESEEELSDMKDELVDRYGSLSTPAVNLLNIALIKSMAHKIGIMEMKGTIEDGPSGCYKTVMKVYPKAEINTEAIPDFIDSFGGAMKLVSGSQPQFIWRVTKKKYNNAGEYLTGIKEMLKLMQNKLQL